MRGDINDNVGDNVGDFINTTAVGVVVITLDWYFKVFKYSNIPLSANNCLIS